MRIGKSDGQGRGIASVPAIPSTGLRPSHPGAGKDAFENKLRSGQDRPANRQSSSSSLSAGELEKIIDWARERLRKDDGAQVVPASAVSWGISSDHLGHLIIAPKPNPANDRDKNSAGFKVADFAAGRVREPDRSALTRIAAEHVFSSEEVADHIAFLTGRIRIGQEAREADLAKQQNGKRERIADLPPVHYRWLSNEEARGRVAVMAPMPQSQTPRPAVQARPRRGLAKWLPSIGATLIAGVMICSVLLLAAHELAIILG